MNPKYLEQVSAKYIDEILKIIICGVFKEIQEIEWQSHNRSARYHHLTAFDSKLNVSS